MLAAIGAVASESSRVEELLRELFCYLIDSPYGRIITTGEDLSALCNSCLKVARYNNQLTEAQLNHLRLIVDAIDECRPKRNFLIHARWEKASMPGDHIGLKSNRALPKKEGNGIEEGKVWGVSDALYVAEAFQLIATHIESLIETFDVYPYMHLISRDNMDKINSAFWEYMPVSWRSDRSGNGSEESSAKKQEAEQGLRSPVIAPPLFGQKRQIGQRSIDVSARFIP